MTIVDEHDTVTRAVELAGRAPSIHNSQPWQFEPHDQQIDVYADLDRWLPATDADGRDLMLSCGAALHHLRVALAAQRVHTAVHRLPATDDPELVAAVQLGAGELPDAELASAISKRRTDRRPFGDWPVPETFFEQLQAVAGRHGSVLRPIDGSWQETLLASVFREAARLQPETPGYGEELREWTVGRGEAEGVPPANVPRAGQVWAAREFPHGAGEQPTPGRQDRAALALLGTASDDPLSQLRAGEALSAVLLQATVLGLASCPLTQPLEVQATRAALEDQVLSGEFSPQVILRLGWPGSDLPAPPPTPRRPVEAILGRRPRRSFEG